MKEGSKAELKGLVSVVFDEVVLPAAGNSGDRPAFESRFKEMQRELNEAREDARLTRESMQATQEELRSANEEMQSLNEELQTVNAELQAKVDEHSRTSSDMKNLLDSTEIATVFVDNDLKVRRYTESATLHPGNEAPLCRIAVSDITALKRATEAQIRAEALQTLNQNLEAEVARRKLTEQSLRESKRRQSVLLSESQTLQKQLRMLSHRILHAQEVERKSISRDLHDEIAQTLAAINVDLASLASDPAAGTEKMQRKIAETQALVAQSVESVHRFAMGLRPTMLDDLGLVPALRACTRNFSEETKLPVDLDLPPDFKPLPDGLGVAFYRVARAALSNIALHAKATKMGLSLRQKQGSLVLRYPTMEYPLT